MTDRSCKDWYTMLRSMRLLVWIAAAMQGASTVWTAVNDHLPWWWALSELIWPVCAIRWFAAIQRWKDIAVRWEKTAGTWRSNYHLLSNFLQKDPP